MQAVNWLGTPVGRRCLTNEQRLVRRTLDSVFGEQLLQIGNWGPSDCFLRYARTQRSALLDADIDADAGTNADAGTDADAGANAGKNSSVHAGADENRRPHLVSRLDQLAIASDTVDAILLPHTLERSEKPHAVVREAARVLRGDGWLIVLGFVPSGLWGLRHMLARDGYPSGSQHMIREGRLRDWLELLSFDVDPAIDYCHTLPFEHVRRFGVLPREAWASRWLPMLAGGYLLVARKRTVNLTPIRPSWQRPRLRAVGGLVKPTTRSTESVQERTGNS